MAAYAAVISLMNNLDQIKNHPHFSTSFDKNQIQFLGQTLDFLLDFIENCKYSDGGIIIEETEELESQIASTAHEAEDIIESYIVDQILGGSTELITPFTTLQKVLQDMDSIKNNVLKVKEDRDIVDHEKRKSSTPVATSTSTGKSSNYMVGFADELYQLKDVLTGQQSSLQIISIVGMGGAGKTSLAKHVYETSIIREHFDIRNWVTISQEYDVREILLGLLSIKGKPIDATVHGLGHQLYKSLFGRRYLIILDDVWSVEVWNEIKCFFPNNENGSRVVLTTRLTNLATSLGTLCFYLNFLDECESWDLFCEKAFGQEECPDELMGIGKKIVERCKGLPLSIVVIGGLLRKSHRTVEYWKNVERNINSVLNSRENGQCLDALYLSYSHLPAHLKPCFLYMGVYREDYKIRVSKMIKLWVAEGFLKPNGVQMLEVIANDYVKDLIDRNLILVCENGSNGKVKSCRMHDLVRDLCLRVASKEKFFSVVMANSIPGGIDRERRLTFHDDHSVYDVLPSSSIARSMICNEVVIIPPKCRLLRVLSSEVVADCIETEFHNFNLRCLDFLVPQTNSKLLPSSISRIWNLQTLIIRNGAYNVVDMTLGIWKMGQLRHLKGFRIYLPDPPQSNKDDDSVVLGAYKHSKE